MDEEIREAFNSKISGAVTKASSPVNCVKEVCDLQFKQKNPLLQALDRFMDDAYELSDALYYFALLVCATLPAIPSLCRSDFARALGNRL